MNVNQLTGTDMSARASQPAVAPNDTTALVPLLWAEELCARPDDFVILFQDEDTARRVAPKVGPGFVCVSMERFKAENTNTDFEPLRNRQVYVWASKHGVINGVSERLSSMLQEE